MKRIIHNSRLSNLAKALRGRGTNEESKLWYKFLRKLPVHFSRQKVVGKYIVDFYCASRKLAIELDGSQHFEDKGLEYDKERDEYLRSLGLKVVRYSNLEVNTKFDSVCQDIMSKLGLE